MNVLVLTPDRVGSTLLQRLITIYMLRRGFDKPVINLHELTNGIEKSFNSKLNCEVLHKPRGTDWGYHQSLSDVESMLSSVDHYKTSRLAHYHIVARRDTIGEQTKFYDYLNKNFFVIGCRRDNVLEHALSWTIFAYSKRLNVYSIDEKVNCFSDVYRKGITVTELSLINYLNKYKQYIEWSDTYFDVQSHFNYDRDLKTIEDYILGLDFMHGHTNNSWQDMFNQSWQDFNTVHRILPNLMIGHNLKQSAALPNVSDNSLFSLQPTTQSKEVAVNGQIVSTSKAVGEYLDQNIESYNSTADQIQTLVSDGYLVTGVPIKLQSLLEKKHIIKNFDQCVDWYNRWVDQNGIGQPYTKDELAQLSLAEETQLNTPVTSALLGSH